MSSEPRPSGAVPTGSTLDAAIDRLRPVLGSLPEGARAARTTGDPATDTAVIRACWDLRISLVLVDGRLPPAERERRLTASGAALQIGDDATTRPLAGRARDPQPSVHVFTSGTTAEARGVPLPWRLLDSSAAAVADAVDLRPDDVWACPLPLAHVAGLGVLLRCWRTGAVPLLLSEPGSETLADALAGATHASLVARTLARLLDEVPRRPLSTSLRCVMVGGGRTDPDLVRRARSAGIPAVTTYGLTEAGSTVALQRLDGPPTAPGDAGWALPHVTLRLDDAGQLRVRPEGLPEVGTGDFARLEPDGRLVVLDRRADRIVSGGENVSPAEVEDVLDRCPGVAETCVVGLSDPAWGQRLAAVVRWSGAPDPPLLDSWARRHLAPWQRPKEQHRRSDPLPRSPLGKLLRRRVRADLVALSAAPRRRD